MKGVVFTEFLEMVELKFGLEVVNTIIEKSDLPYEGTYTLAGTYNFKEMVSLITNLHDQVKALIGDLIFDFRFYLFHGLGNFYPEVIKTYSTPINLLYAIEDHIHGHIKKLYLDPELLKFKIWDKTDSSISMINSSSRGLYRLTQGLIEKLFKLSYGTTTIYYKLLKENSTEVKFEIILNG